MGCIFIDLCVHCFSIYYFIYTYMYIQKFGWYLQMEESSIIRQSERIQIYSQSSQTPLTDCFTVTGSSEGNLKQHTTA